MFNASEPEILEILKQITFLSRGERGEEKQRGPDAET
jgi:hypothetical protein